MTLTPQRRCAQRLLGAEDFKPRGYTGDNSLYLEVISTWTEHGRFLLYVHDPCAFWFAHHFTITAGSFFFLLMLHPGSCSCFYRAGSVHVSLLGPTLFYTLFILLHQDGHVLHRTDL